MLSCDPLDSIRKTIEDKWCGGKAEEEYLVKVEAPLPLHAEEVMVTGVDWAETKSTFDFDLGHE